MPLWTRVFRLFRSDRLNAEIDEELESHIEQAIEDGIDAAEARRAFGPKLRWREESRDARLVHWLECLRADVVFGWRQLTKTKVTSVAAIVSLALGIGACTSAFRLIDALLLRPLPIHHPERLYDLYRQEIGWDGKPGTFDGWAYPIFRQMRAAVQDQADLIAISYAERADLTYKSADETEKAYLQYVSGGMFDAFGIHPALGRLFTANDDRQPGAHPFAVISYDYWIRRFQQDPSVIGRAFRRDDRLYQIIGVAGESFTGTEPGTMIDIFVPSTMSPSVTNANSTWHRTLVMLKPGVAVAPLSEKLDALSIAFERERAKGFTNLSKQLIDNYLHQRVMLEPASTGVSDLQNSNRRALITLGILVGLVLLIACANVANLMTAQASSRQREMALRVSIGAGRWRLVQLVLIESAMLAVLAAALGGLFAWISAPLVVSMINTSDNPARLALPADWRLLAFGLGLTIGVTLLFGLIPALRASATRPISALRGGESSRERFRLSHGLIAVQVAFCCLVLFVAGLFAQTFQRLSKQPVGFSSDRLLTLETTVLHGQPSAMWDQVAAYLRSVPGVERVAFAGWPLLSGHGSNDSVSIHGGPASDDLTYFLSISPGWLDVMKIPLIEGADFRADDTYPGAAIVNQTFVKRYFPHQDALGQSFDKMEDEGGRIHLRIAGIVKDARYRGIREPIPPIAYLPFNAVRAGSGEPIERGTFIVRTKQSNPLALASVLRREVSRAQREFHVSNIRTQLEINQALTVRERLLANLAVFFAGVALLLALVGLYGVVNYSVLQRRREFGIRIAIGAPAKDIAVRVVAGVFVVVAIGASGGLALGFVCGRYLQALLYQVQVTDIGMLAMPCLELLLAALLASLPPVIRALRIDPAAMLHSE